MKKKDNAEKKCVVCGKILTSPNKKLLCPGCKKSANTGGTFLGMLGGGMLIKKHGKDIINAAKTLIRK